MRIPKFSIVLHLAVKAIFHLLQYCLADQLASQLLTYTNFSVCFVLTYNIHNIDLLFVLPVLYVLGILNFISVIFCLWNLSSESFFIYVMYYIYLYSRIFIPWPHAYIFCEFYHI